MATACTLLCEDQLLCSICLEVFTDPVSTPCGHNFCKKCITQHWDSNLKNQCPMCKETFNARPNLHVNTFISEVAAQFKETVQEKEKCRSSEQKDAKAGEVLCDVCNESKRQALKSCLMCLTSYCESHLDLHQNMTVGTKHILIDPVENLLGRICKKHERPLELFCKTDQICVCKFCSESKLDHYEHSIVLLDEEYEGKKGELEKKRDHIGGEIGERQQKIEQIRQSVKLSKEDADKVMAASAEACKALIASVEAGLAQLIEVTEEKQKATEKQAEIFIKDLEEEISELMKNEAEVVQLCSTEDHLDFLQSFPSLNPLPPTKNWTQVRICPSHAETMKETVTTLMKTVSAQTNRLLNVIELKRLRQYAVDVTLDPETAHPALVLLDDGKQVRRGDVLQELPDSPNRFSDYAILGKQGFSSGKFYFEVQVKDKTDWVLGVARESANRKDVPVTFKTGFWALKLLSGEKYVLSRVSSKTLRTKPQKVGVFVSYEEGLVSFYDVVAETLIHSCTCTWTCNEKLYPFFNPGLNVEKNSAPLVICPVGIL